MMIIQTDRFEVSVLSEIELQPGIPPLAASFLSGPGLVGSADQPPALLLVDQPLPGDLEALAAPALDRQPRPFPPAASESSLAGLPASEQRALQAVYSAFFAVDDPYLEAGDLTLLAERLDLNETRFRHSLDGLGAAGLLRPARGENGEIELVESTAHGTEAFCRAFRADYPVLLAEIGRRVADSSVTDGPALHAAFADVPGLLLTHAVDTLARGGWLECTEHFGGSCGFQIASVSPELKAWASGENSPVWAGISAPAVD